MLDYDPKVIRKSSEQMYFSSEIIRFILPAAGVLIGGSVGFSMFKVAGALVGAGGVGYLGYRFGDVKATQMKSEAQSALCLAKIEENTRPKPSTTSDRDHSS